MGIRVFISYHRADSNYRNKMENILNNAGISYYAVPEDADFDGKKAETIKNFLCKKLKQCDVLICLIGLKTFSRPHVDREIHTALKGLSGSRLGIVGVLLPTRNDSLKAIDTKTFPVKLWQNKDYIVWSEFNDLNTKISDLIRQAYENSKNPKIQTNHSNPCMPLRSKLYYDN